MLTESARLSGLLLVAGALTFFVGAGMPVYKAWSAATLGEYLAVLRARPTAWAICQVAMCAAAPVTAAGVGLTAWELAQPLAIAAAFAYTAGAAVWCIFTMYRLSVQPFVARLQSAPPDWFLALEELSGRLFPVFMLTSYSSIAALGLAVSRGTFLPAWSGWAVFAFSLAGAVSLATGLPRLRGGSPFEPPFMTFLPTLLVGSLLLLRG